MSAFEPAPSHGPDRSGWPSGRRGTGPFTWLSGTRGVPPAGRLAIRFWACVWTSNDTVRPMTVVETTSIRFITALPRTSEVDLSAELEHPAAENLQWSQPLASRCAGVPRGHVEHVARVEQVVEISVPAHAHLPDAEAPRETDVHLPQPLFEVAAVRNHVDDDAGVAGRGAAALPEIAAERLPNLRVRVR